MKRTPQILIIGAAVACLLAPSLVAQELINNGGFESGFTGWTRVDQVGSEGTWAQQSGTTSPVNMFAVPAPPGGSNAAMTDAQGPGSHILYQDFTVPMTLAVTTLSFDLFIRNHASAFFSPNTLDFATPALNQQFRVDIITTTADPFSVTMGDVLFTVYQTQPGDPLISGYTTITADLTALFAAHPGETLRLRFAEVDNVNFFNAGVDNVSIVPEPTTVSLLVAAAAVLAARRIRRRS
ncbi:MAG TPA: PEP-CTERM sorting domain-containing protein [Chthoniobacterales bacterium]|nr:PEP-CTERM sorting domain-containing protein [Chthoniobacterales bacterium]